MARPTKKTIISSAVLVALITTAGGIINAMLGRSSVVQAQASTVTLGARPADGTSDVWRQQREKAFTQQVQTFEGILHHAGACEMEGIVVALEYEGTRAIREDRPADLSRIVHTINDEVTRYNQHGRDVR